MNVATRCPCGQQYTVSQQSVGYGMTCSHCGQSFLIQPGAIGPADAQSPNRSQQHQTPQHPPQTAQTPMAPSPSAGTPNAFPTHRVHVASRGGSGNGSQAWRWGILGVGCLAAIGLIVLLVNFFGSGNSVRGISLKYLPANVHQLSHIKVAEIVESESGKRFLANSQRFHQNLQTAAQATGIDLEEIESVTIGYGTPEIDDEAFDISAPQKNPMEILKLFDRVFNFCGVIRTKVDFDEEKVLDFAGKISEESHNGKPYYRVKIRSQLSMAPGAVAFPESKVILFGTEPEVLAALDGSSAKNRDFFAAVENDDHVVIVQRNDLSPMMNVVSSGNAIKFKEKPEYRTWVDFASAADAAEYQHSVQAFQNLAGGFANAMGESIPDELLAGGKDVKTEVRGKTIFFRHINPPRDAILTSYISASLFNLIPNFAKLDLNPLAVASDGIDEQRKKMAESMLQTKQALRKKWEPGMALPKSNKAGPTIASFPAYRPGNGTVVNLLDFVQPEHDALDGRWEFREGKLILAKGQFRARFEIPFTPPEEYDLTVVFKNPEKFEMTALICPNGKESFSWVINPTFRHAFLSHRTRRQNDPKISFSDRLKGGVARTLTVQVRKKTVKGILDGRVLVEADRSRLTRDIRTRIKNQTLLGFASDAAVEVQSIRLIEVSGKGSVSDK